MNTEDIIRMAREAGFDPHDMSDDFTCNLMDIERFADLVVTAERERIKWDTIHSCHPECDKPVCVAIRKAVAAEREACALAAEAVVPRHTECGNKIAAAIRARGDALAKLNQASEDNGEPL
jgi:hypothetical protein